MNRHFAVGFQEDLLHFPRFRVPLVDRRRETGVDIASSRRNWDATAGFGRATLSTTAATRTFATSTAAILRPPFALDVVVVLPATDTTSVRLILIRYWCAMNGLNNCNTF